MALKLNRDNEYRQIDGRRIPLFVEFHGKGIEQIPKLFYDGRVPMSVAGLMERKLDVRSGPADVKTAWMDNAFTTGDAVRWQGGKMKVVLDFTSSMGVGSYSQLFGGRLVLPYRENELLEGEEFSVSDVFKYTDKPHTSLEAKSNPIWRALAKGNQTLLNDFVDYIFSEYRQRYAPNEDIDEIKLLGICRPYGGFPGWEFWYVKGLWYKLTSYMLGQLNLGNDHNCLVGIDRHANLRENLKK